MPIMDGYRATHNIRHHAPFINSSAIQKIPIVAMTASAIQGDREKCKKAGMDDYLAKPVRGRMLENMLLKWACEDRPAPPNSFTERSRSDSTDHDSDCVDGRDTPATQAESPDSLEPRNDTGCSAAERISMDTGGATGVDYLTSKLDDINSSDMAQTENDRHLQRVAAKEQAMALRNDKLFAATENPHSLRRPASRSLDASSGLLRSGEMMQLTAANVKRLGDEQGRSNDGSAMSGMRPLKNGSGEEEFDGILAAGDRSDSFSGHSRASTRPPLGGRRQWESQTTIRPGSP